MNKSKLNELSTSKLRELLQYYYSFVESLEAQSEDSLNMAERQSRTETLKEANATIAEINKALDFRKTLPNPPSSSLPPNLP